MFEQRKKFSMRVLFGNKAFYKRVILLSLPIMIQNAITNFVNGIKIISMIPITAKNENNERHSEYITDTSAGGNSKAASTSIILLKMLISNFLFITQMHP